MIDNQLFRFAIISLLTNGSGFALAITLNSLGISPLISSSTSYIYSLGVSYVLQAKFTFRTEISAVSFRTVKFLMTHVIGFSLNATIIYFLTSMDISFFQSQIISTALCGISIYSLNKFWVFGQETRH